MKTRTYFLLSLSLGLAVVGVPRAKAQGTAFTYQGRLNSDTNFATGLFDLTFTLFSVSSGAGQVGTPITNSATAVTNGLFTTSLDFGAGKFPGANRWLEIAVRTNGGGAFATLSPRQRLSPVPYAITAGSVVSGGLSAGTYASAVMFNNPANSFSGDGSGLTGVDATTVGGVSATNLWQLAGNAGTTPGTHFIGTTDNQPLEFKVNGVRALRIQSGTNAAPNLVGGSPNNTIDGGVRGATIGGGAGFYFGANYTNRVSADFGTVAGGAANQIASNAFFATISGGLGNSIYSNASRATISGGDGNVIEGNDQVFFANYSVIAGGFGNLIQRQNGGCTISGGLANRIQTNAIYANISGGRDNVVGTTASASSIGGGQGNSIETDATYAVISGGRDNRIRETAYSSAIGGGEGNVIETLATWSLIGGGLNNRIFTSYGTVGGGFGNRIDQFSIGGTIGGGQANLIRTNVSYGTIPGGLFNTVEGNYGLAAGFRGKAKHAGSFVWADTTDLDFPSTASNQFSVRATGGVRLVSAVDATNGFPTAGVELAAGGGSWSSLSDRNAKENIQLVNPRSLLDHLIAIPISTWNYKSQDTAVRHIGPMAQDFHSAFAVGEDNAHITAVDGDGVALAAIQGLNQKLEERLKAKDAEIAQLKSSIEELRQLVLKSVQQPKE